MRPKNFTFAVLLFGFSHHAFANDWHAALITVKLAAQ